MHIEENKKLAMQKIEDADGANNWILNFLIFVLSNKRDPTSQGQVPLRVGTIVEKLLHLQVMNCKSKS
jgi:hypothetical protein